VVTLAVVAAGLAAPAYAGAAPTIGAVGVNDLRSDAILLPAGGWNGLTDLDLAAAGGIQLYRARIQLNCVDPAHSGEFNFTTPSPGCAISYDALVGALAARGITLLPVLINLDGQTPQPPTVDGSNGSPTIAEFAAFAAAAVARYGPTGSYWSTCGCTPHPIHAWEIWNEENNGWWWDGDASPAAYAAVFQATRAALRSVDPHARAVVGGLTFDPNGQPSFVDPDAIIQALAAGNANAFDAVAVHPYTDATGATSAQLAAGAMAAVGEIADDVVAATGAGPGGAPRQQIWVTEMGWSNQAADPNVIAGGLADFFALLDGGDRALDNVGPVLWYDLRDNSTLTTLDDQLGLRYTNPDGSDAGPKPAWGVLTAAAQSEGTIALPPALANSGPYLPAASRRTLAGVPHTAAASGGRRTIEARRARTAAHAAVACHALKARHRRRYRGCVRRFERRHARRHRG
jgi:hypothetical protein